MHERRRYEDLESLARELSQYTCQYEEGRSWPERWSSPEDEVSICALMDSLRAPALALRAAAAGTHGPADDPEGWGAMREHAVALAGALHDGAYMGDQLDYWQPEEWLPLLALVARDVRNVEIWREPAWRWVAAAMLNAACSVLAWIDAHGEEPGDFLTECEAAREPREERYDRDRQPILTPEMLAVMLGGEPVGATRRLVDGGIPIGADTVPALRVLD